MVAAARSRFGIVPTYPMLEILDPTHVVSLHPFGGEAKESQQGRSLGSPP